MPIKLPFPTLAVLCVLAAAAFAAEPEPEMIIVPPAPAPRRMDDLRRLQLLHKTLQEYQTLPGKTPEEQIAFYTNFQQTLRIGRENAQAWRLTALTDLNALPDGENMIPYWAQPARGAPVNEDGTPIYYEPPESWEAAKNDGERWRWVLSQMAQVNETGKTTAEWILAEFLTTQFGVQTMTEWPAAREAAPAKETGPYAVRTLKETETIARLATGLKRFAMPDEFNHIKILRSVAESDNAEPREKATALLASIFENRQQYPKAAELWRRLPDRKDARNALERITANTGALEPTDEPKTLSYLYRNGKSAAFTATRLDEQKLLADLRAQLRKGDADFFENTLHHNPEQLARIAIEKSGEKYKAGIAAEWELDLDPLPDHFSRRIDVKVPLDKAGCYLVEATMRDGNTSRVVLWIADLALVMKDSAGEQMLFAADAESGGPVADATVSFLSLNWRWDDGARRYDLRESAGRTNADGLLFVPSEKVRNRECLVTATTEDGRFAYIGFRPVWALSPQPDMATQAAAFLLTDRPVYRPGQEVRFKAWISGENKTPATVTIHNPRGETVLETILTPDEYGGVEGSFTPEKNAVLGQYYIALRANEAAGGIGFMVEEYKKPEFEVSLAAPDHALVLGGSVQLKLNAAYYYGAPVTDAKATYRILRTPRVDSWIPLWRWDWLYGAGAWMRSESIAPPRMPFRRMQPELVAEGEGAFDADGVFRFTLDTAPAKELFGDQDHEYQITFDVTDKSRRTISGSGRVVATREPFSVKVWTDRGYFRAGDEIRANVQAVLPLGGGVAAKGTAILYTISNEEVEKLPVKTDAEGAAAIRFRAKKAGQYRLVVRLENVEGAALLTVRGDSPEEESGADFRFAALELIPDKRDYRPGETLRLAINSERPDAVVLFVPRAERGKKRPQLIRLKNGTRLEDITIGRADQPNFYCEAITVFGGKIHSETREIFVPPADKTLNVEIVPDKESYLPGETAAFAVAVTDADGEPVAGQCAVSLYDKSVEYISGGSNAGDIRATFWSWKRNYFTNLNASLLKQSYAVRRDGDALWQPIGVFGGEEADWNNDERYANSLVPQSRAATGGGMLGGMAMESAAVVSADMAAPMAMAPAPMAQKEMAYAGGGDAGATAEPVVRSEFADTAFWTGALETDADGIASFTVVMPENLTAWKARVWVMGAEVRVGDGEREVTTKKNVIVRPQAPRFLTQKDQVILSANLHNYLPRAKRARAELVLDGGLLEPAEGTALTKTVELAAGGEARVDWLVDAKRPGTATIIMKLLTDEESDAAEISVPVLVHGARRVENFSAVLRPGESREVIRFRVPEERLPDQSRFEFSFSPSIAVSLLEALPYLIEYPYGCTEQTLNRFLPAVTVRKYLGALGVSLADAQRIPARDDAQSAGWRDRYGDDRARLHRLPVFDDGELDAMVSLGVERLAGMQNADGGWGWFSGAGERSWLHTTAVVVHGLQSARAAGVALPFDMLDRGIEWLVRNQAEQIALLEEKDEEKDRKESADNLDAFLHMLLANAGKADPRMRDFLFRDRAELSLAGRVLLGLALEAEGRAEELGAVLGELAAFVTVNEANSTAFLDIPHREYWRWYNDSIETQAWYLKLLAKVDPRSGVASGLAKYLLANRKNGAYWRSTRDTANAIEALSAYAAASGETAPDMNVRLFLDGKLVRERRLTRENILDDNLFVLDGLAVEAGAHELVIERDGDGALYCGGSLSVFSLEDPIPPAGGPELSVSRSYFKLVPAAGSVDIQTSTGVATRASVAKYDRVPLSGLSGTVSAGDLVEVELSISSANDYEYLVFEDRKAAGLEAVEVRSGYAGNRLGAYAEYRDDRVALFVRSLPRGEHTIAYRFRAETPGAFSALPVFGGGMYATDLFCNSSEMKIRVVEEGAFE